MNMAFFSTAHAQADGKAIRPSKKDLYNDKMKSSCITQYTQKRIDLVTVAYSP